MPNPTAHALERCDHVTEKGRIDQQASRRGQDRRGRWQERGVHQAAPGDGLQEQQHGDAPPRPGAGVRDRETITPPDAAATCTSSLPLCDITSDQNGISCAAEDSGSLLERSRGPRTLRVGCPLRGPGDIRLRSHADAAELLARGGLDDGCRASPPIRR